MERKFRFEIFENLGIPREVVLFLSIRRWKMPEIQSKMASSNGMCPLMVAQNSFQHFPRRRF